MKTYIKLPFALSILALTSNAIAGGLALPQIGTTQSTGTAGVGNVTNNRDASAVVANPAAMSGIQDSSFVLGLQYLDVNNNFERDIDGATTNGSIGMVMPHLSYAKRINDKWVVGVASHAPGGLGLEYDNGLTGLPPGVINSTNLSIVNFTGSASYQVNDKLSLGGSIIAQYAYQEAEFKTGHSVSDEDWSPAFALSALYQFTPDTQMGIAYNYGGQHDLTIEGNDADINWPQSVEVGVQHQLTDKMAVMASANWQQWSAFNDRYDDTYGAGVAMSYQLDSWTIHTGISADSSPLTSDQRGHALPLDQQWRVGFGAEKTLKNGMILGIAYQYQDLGSAEITGLGNVNGENLNGEYSDNRVHIITGSLKF